MADLKISQLNSIVTVVPATDVLPVVQGGTTLKITPNQILGAGGTATLASATITGAATVGTTLGVTGQLSTANVLKTTGNPGLSAAGATEAFVAHNTGYGAILYGQGTTCDAALLDRNTSLRLTVTTSGAQVSGDLSMTSGNVVMSTSGKGIDFSAVTGGTGTATANVLNDYEEGTWTPAIGGTATYTAQTGTYTKVGRLVTASFDITILLRGTGDSFAVSGLPFAASANVGAAVAVSYFSGLATSSASIYGYVNTAAIAFNLIAAGGGTSPSGAVVITNGTRLAGTAVYMV